MLPARQKKILDGILGHGRIANGYLFHGSSADVLAEATGYFTRALGCGVGSVFVCDPETASIGVDSVRQIQDWVKFGPSGSGYLVVQVVRIERFTMEAANAFLKTLEEPLPRVCFLLTTCQLFRILPTIRSRCQLLDFPGNTPVPEDVVSYWDLLQMPLFDRLVLSEKLSLEKGKLGDVLQGWVGDIESSYERSSEADFDAAKLMIEILLHLQYNLNQRLQLDSLVLRLP